MYGNITVLIKNKQKEMFLEKCRCGKPPTA
jgi:hypothetical protein